MSKTQCQTTWARWDNAWELGVSTSDRVAILKDCAVPDFKYSNPDIEFAPGDFEAIANWIEPALNAYGGKITVKPLKWHEHHRRSASQWDSKFPTSCECLQKRPRVNSLSGACRYWRSACFRVELRSVQRRWEVNDGDGFLVIDEKSQAFRLREWEFALPRYLSATNDSAFSELSPAHVEDNLSHVSTVKSMISR
jgi:hypothetical protein